FKLKKGFKEIFRCTIHTYTIKYRMEKAKQLMEGQQMQIREVATQLGYKNPSHFSAAFRKHFGILPTDMANGIRGQGCRMPLHTGVPVGATGFVSPICSQS